MLNNRKKQILQAVIEEYINTAEPVSSGTIVEKYGLDFSSATIRNDMMELEEEGLIVKTHLSSGRVPSEEGYRVYVQEILKDRDNKDDTFPMIDEIFENPNVSQDEAIYKSMELVTQLTNYA